MQKKFVSLDAAESPSPNPYEIRTFLGENARPDWSPNVYAQERQCRQPNSTISKVLTIEDELRSLHQKAKDSRFKKPFKKKCERFDDFTECVVPQRTPHDLKLHARMREKYLLTQMNLKTRVHEGNQLKPDTPSLVALQNPMEVDEEEEEEDKEYGSEEGEEEEGEQAQKVRVRLASPSPSMDIIFKPPQKLLELHRPKSGMFLNQSEQPELEDFTIPYSTYNPRLLQEEFDAQDLDKIDMIESNVKNEGWTWNVGIQKRASDLERQFNMEINPDIDRNNLELRLYKIPTDLHKTFNAVMVFGNRSAKSAPLSTRKEIVNKRPIEMAAMFAAYIESFHVNPDFWVAETMDSILNTADSLIKKSEKLNYKSADNDFDILPIIVEKQASVGLKVHFTGPLLGDPNIFKVLELYFTKFNAAVLNIQNLFLLIWKRCHSLYYVYDPHGRSESCDSNDEGRCALMSIPHVEHLVCLIMDYSNVDKNADFNLYEIFLINYGKLTVPVPTKPTPKTIHRRWNVINKTFAIIPGINVGLQQPVLPKDTNTSMIISLVALLYSDIQRAMTWSASVINDLIRFGQAFVKSYLKKHKKQKKKNAPHMNIMNVPEMMILGVYKAVFKKGPFFFAGHIADCQYFENSQLTFALKELFNSKWESALLEIDNSTLSVWRDNDYYYIFDPFRRSKLGGVLDPEDYLTKGAACLQMHTDLESVCRVLYTKALAIRRGGKLFLHGINIACIKPFAAILGHGNKFTGLQITYPKFTEEQEIAEKVPAKKKGSAKKKAGKLAQKTSIQSIPSEELIPEYDDHDVVDGVIEDALWDILHALPEDKIKRPHPYKQVERVLLKSDKSYLKKLQYDMRHGQDIDNIFDKYRSIPDSATPVMSLEEELMIPSNFILLPDGTWIIFGTVSIPDSDNTKLSGLLSSLVAAAMSAKYKISTWNEKLVDFALDSPKNFGEEFNDYQKTLELMLSKRIPRIALGDDFFLLTVKKVFKSSAIRPLRQVLLESLISYNRVLVVCQRFSCLIIKRYNFLYVFTGFPCNAIGYRKFSPGPGCLLRLVELDSLIRRIEFGCNPEGCEVTNFVLVALKVQDITNVPPERYRTWAESDEDEIVASEMKAYEKQRQHRLNKIRFLDQELRKEDERIKSFLTEKERRLEERRMEREQRCHPKRYARKMKAKQRAAAAAALGEEDYEDEDEEELEEEGEEEEEIELKHKPGKRLKRMLDDDFKPRPILYGYRLREKDCLFKIQGSTAIESRSVYAVQEIKPCYFASIMAILFAILRPLNQWSSQRVDKVIESANGIVSKVTNMTTAFERVIKNITVDDYEFDVWVKTHEPIGVWGSTLDRKIAKTTQTRHYLMLQTANATYAIYRDDYYHLFDPYPSMEKLQEEEEEENEGEEGGGCMKKFKFPKDVKRYGERNTASWVLFVDVESMLEYIDQRCAYADWKEHEEFKLHIIDVISYKKASPKRRILQLLTDMSVPMTCETGHHGEYEAEICAHAESLSWIDLDNCLPIWSRMNRRNAAGKYRNLPVTKLKKYDIEIEGRLWSLWGTLHPTAVVFDAASRGKSHLACNVIACCAASVYRLVDWSPQLLDNIVISGDRYHRKSVANIKRIDYEFSLEDLNIECTLEKIRFVLHIEHRAYGKLYCTPTKTCMNLAEAMMYFFSHFQYGIIQCEGRSLGIGYCKGHDGGYFMYDCQSREHPLFPKGQGATYVLRMRHLQVLLYCVVVTLNIPYYNVKFTIHQVAMLREGASMEKSEEEEEEQMGGDV